MRRNNGWLAVLAVSVVLSTLRNSLAGERYPLDYGNTELPVNRSRAAYGSRNSNRLSLNSQNHRSSRQHSSTQLSSPTKASQSSLLIKQNIVPSTEPYQTISSLRTDKIIEFKSSNFPSKNAASDRSTFTNDPRKFRHADDPVNSVEAKKLRGSKSGTQNPRSTSRFHRKSSQDQRLSVASIEDNHATHLFGESFTAANRKTERIRRERELVDSRYPYYGHVNSRSRDSTTTGETADAQRLKGSVGEREAAQIERSDKVNGLQAIESPSRDIGDLDIGYSKSLRDVEAVAASKRITKNGYLKGDSETSVFANKALSGKLELDNSGKLTDAGRLGDRDEDVEASKSLRNGEIRRKLGNEEGYSTENSRQIAKLRSNVSRVKLKSGNEESLENLTDDVIRNQIVRKSHLNEDLESFVSTDHQFNEQLKSDKSTVRDKPETSKKDTAFLYDLSNDGKTKFIPKPKDPSSPVSTNHPLDAKLELSRSERRENRSVYDLINSLHRWKRSVRSRRNDANGKSRIFAGPDVMNREASYFASDSKLSNGEPRNEKLETEKTEREDHHSSRYDGFQFVSQPHKSATSRRQTENTRELDGISSKQRSTIGNNDLGDREIQYTSPIPDTTSIALTSPENEATLWNLTSSYETRRNFLDKAKGDAEKLGREFNLTNNLADVGSNETRINETRLNYSDLTLSSENNSVRSDSMVDSSERIKVDESNFSLVKLEESKENDSRLGTNTAIFGNEFNSMIRNRKINSFESKKLEDPNVLNSSELILNGESNSSDDSKVNLVEKIKFDELNISSVKLEVPKKYDSVSGINTAIFGNGFNSTTYNGNINSQERIKLEGVNLSQWNNLKPEPNISTFDEFMKFNSTSHNASVNSIGKINLEESIVRNISQRKNSLYKDKYNDAVNIGKKLGQEFNLTNNLLDVGLKVGSNAFDINETRLNSSDLMFNSENNSSRDLKVNSIEKIKFDESNVTLVKLQEPKGNDSKLGMNNSTSNNESYSSIPRHVNKDSKDRIKLDDLLNAQKFTPNEFTNKYNFSMEANNSMLNNEFDWIIANASEDSLDKTKLDNSLSNQKIISKLNNESSVNFNASNDSQLNKMKSENLIHNEEFIPDALITSDLRLKFNISMIKNESATVSFNASKNLQPNKTEPEKLLNNQPFVLHAPNINNSQLESKILKLNNESSSILRNTSKDSQLNKTKFQSLLDTQKSTLVASNTNDSRLESNGFKLNNESSSIPRNASKDSQLDRSKSQSLPSTQKFVSIASNADSNSQLKSNVSKLNNESSSVPHKASKDPQLDRSKSQSLLNTQNFAAIASSTNPDSQLESKNISIPENEFPSNSRKELSGAELDAFRTEIDDGEANKATPSEGSALSNATKESENVFANSERGSLAARRNATYLRHDMSSLAQGNTASKSGDVSRVNARNVDDPFGESSTDQANRSTENFKINTHSPNSFANKAKQGSKHPLSSEDDALDSQREADIDDAANRSTLTTDGPSGNSKETLIVSKEKDSVDSSSLNQNSRANANEIKGNEVAIGFPWKNGKSSSDNGKTDEVNPTAEGKKSIAASRRSNDSFSSLPDHPPKERKSRSSKIRSSTVDPKLSTAKAAEELSEEASTSMKRDEDVRRSNVSTRRIDSASSKVDDDIAEPSSATLERPLELSSLADQFNLSTLSDRDAKSPQDEYANENVTVSFTDLPKFNSDQVPIKMWTTGLFDGEDQAFAFDTIVTSLDPNEDQDFHIIVDDASSRSADNSSQLSDKWPVKHSAIVEGDLVLGGLMMVHEREDTYICGPVMPQGGVQALEAMLYTLDRLNDREIVPGVKIGAHILDDCDKDTYGLEMAVDFIKGSISNIDGAEYHCNKTAVRKVISGVVGAASSVTSIQVANLLRLFRIPQVSFFSTSPELSNKQRFEYFSRTIPSDHYQVKAMVDIVLKMGWSYVSIIYEESNYGIKAFEELEDLLGKYDICIAIKEKLVKDSGVAEETAYDNIVSKLLTKPRARGCIIFGSDQEVAGVMRAVRRCNATGAFSWIGSDGWSARGLVSNGNEPEVEGTLSVQPQANPVKGFEEYFLNLTVENNRRNPWFVEFWEDHFQCRYPNASKTPYNIKYSKPCTTKERLTKQNTAFEDQLQFVSDAVMAFAYAFRDMHRDLCNGKPGLCEAMKPTKGTELLKYLRKVDFEGLSGDKFKFDKNGDGPARYNIIHFKQVEPGKYKWIRVGKYLEGELRLNMSEIQFKLGHPQPPESVCSLPCEVGQAKKYVEGERCCWHCFNCTQYQIRHPKDETQCIPCRQGTVPDETHSTCRDIPEEFLRPESGWAIGAMSFSATGMFITFFVCGVFLKHNDTPVVRASGRELSYVLLSGILLCYLVTFALVLRPTDIVCGIQRFAAGFCFTVVYAALLTKTNRISRIFNASKHSAKRPSFISPRSQLIICSGLVFVQILINGVWMIIDPAIAMHHYPTREDNLLVCSSYIDASYMIAFAYPIMLIVVCTVYAVLTRKIPEAFNESKHIGFTMYTTCVIWLAFVPLYFGTGNNVALRITSMSVTISLSASVTIACLFSPKLYIILIRPERNVRQSMMPARYSTTKSSAVTATNASSMIAPVTLTAATCDQNKAVKKHITTTIDCSTQSEYYELEVKDQKNGKPPPTVVSRSTQTSNNNDKDSNTLVSSKESKESTTTTKQLNNNARIGNGPVNQSDVPL